MRFRDKVVLITGGSRGIGAAISMAFAEEGARVAINYRSNLAAAEALMKKLPGNDHAAFRANIGDALSVKTLVDQVTEHYGKIDVLVSNAGIHEHHPLDKVSYEQWQDEWRKTLDVNLIGASNMTYLVANHMIRQEIRGRIIFVGSRGAFRGEPQQPAYGASKGGLHAFAQSMAVALGVHKIGVGVVAPGFVQTEMVAHILDGEAGSAIKAQSPFNRVARPEEVANAVLYLADPKSLWSSGAIIDVNGASYLR